MTGHVVHQPTPQHHCDPPDQDVTRVCEVPTMTWPGEQETPAVTFHPWMAEHTVWQCDCGQRWRATYPYANVFAPTWIKVRTPRPKNRRSLLAWLGIRPRR